MAHNIRAKLIIDCSDNWVEGLIVTDNWGAPNPFACHRIGGETEEIAIGHKSNGTYTTTLEAAIADMAKRSKYVYGRHGADYGITDVRNATTATEARQLVESMKDASPQFAEWMRIMEEVDADPTADLVEGIKNHQA